MNEHLSLLANSWTEVLKELEPDDHEAIEYTPGRVYRMLQDCLSGYQLDPEKGFKEFEFIKSNDLVVVREMPFFSMCKHHILPFYGKAHVGYLPEKKVIGLSKIARAVKIYSRRLQIQERLGRQICDSLMESAVSPRGVIVVLEAQHLCMQMRGIESLGSITTTASLAGAFTYNSDLKREFYQLISKTNGN